MTSDVILPYSVTVAMLGVLQQCNVVNLRIRLQTDVWGIIYGPLINPGKDVPAFRNVTRLLITLSIPPTWRRGFVLSSLTSPHLMYNLKLSWMIALICLKYVFVCCMILCVLFKRVFEENVGDSSVSEWVATCCCASLLHSVSSVIRRINVFTNTGWSKNSKPLPNYHIKSY